MARLLVSVRSAEEARAGVEGGAAIIDVKEPGRGPLGRADGAVWRAVRAAVPESIPVSIALGELPEWTLDRVEKPDSGALAGIAYRKLGLAGAGTDWAAAWARLRDELGAGPSWIAVAYADWSVAGAPRPEAVLDVALASADCAGVLVDTWNKDRPSPIDGSWSAWFGRARRGGLLVALAGGLDEHAIVRLAPLQPDLFAVRGAACAGGDRHAPIDPRRVARLVRAAEGLR